MTHFPIDSLVFTPFLVDLERSPLAGCLGVETYVLGAFNPGMTVLPNGNILLMVRVAEALRTPVRDGKVHAIRWHDGGYVIDAWPVELADTADPRKFVLHGGGWKVMALTSLSWLLPVEMTADGLDVIAIHYDKAIAPQGTYQCYGIEDARISNMGEGAYLMTTCSVSPERHSTTLYSSENGLDWKFEGVVLDHQNKDMLIFEGLIKGDYWAQTRPLGDLYFAYPPGSNWRSGPSINLATSPDALHWRPYISPGIRPPVQNLLTARIGGGTPPILTDINGLEGWLSLWHGVEPHGIVGVYRTFWSLLDPDDPSQIIAGSQLPLLEPDAALTRSMESLLYLRDVVFTTGIAEKADRFIVASGEADLACRITHVPKTALIAMS